MARHGHMLLVLALFGLAAMAAALPANPQIKCNASICKKDKSALAGKKGTQTKSLAVLGALTSNFCVFGFGGGCGGGGTIPGFGVTPSTSGPVWIGPFFTDDPPELPQDTDSYLQIVSCTGVTSRGIVGFGGCECDDYEEYYLTAFQPANFDGNGLVLNDCGSRVSPSGDGQFTTVKCNAWACMCYNYPMRSWAVCY